MMPGMPERRTHDYVRHRTTSLFAAFNIADGTVIGELHRRHRAAEYKKFLATIDKAVPAGLDVRSPAAMLVQPRMRRRAMTLLRKAALARGTLPLPAREASSLNASVMREIPDQLTRTVHMPIARCSGQY